MIEDPPYYYFYCSKCGRKMCPEEVENTTCGLVLRGGVVCDGVLLSTLTPDELEAKVSKLRADCVLKFATPGAMVNYAGSLYEVAHQKEFPHGTMVGIYDEPPGDHVDYINPRNLTVPRS
jgi:hypothetical protein